jgi:nicotinamide-nucleotide amidase
VVTQLAREVGEALKARGMRLATAESCTGGGVGAAVTEIAGSSEWFDRGFITYSNEAKQDMLGVSAETLSRHGAVSEATVTEMASGALARSRAHLTLAISGIAGPGGGTPEKPVGLVWFAWARHASPVETESRIFSGDRHAIREQAVIHALKGVLARSGI